MAKKLQQRRAYLAELLGRDITDRRAISHPDLLDEKSLATQGYDIVAGVDEVGRGALAGPVAVGIAILRADIEIPSNLRDSKLLSSHQRDQLFEILPELCSHWAVGMAAADECDAMGMTRALGIAARRALDLIDICPEAILLDGPHDYISGQLDPTLPATVIPIVGGDNSSCSVAAASVLAKVTRDRLMHKLHAEYPAYDWEHCVGYSSPQHMAAISKYGPTPYHRVSWSTFRQAPDEQYEQLTLFS